jgi:hypothetical protein
MKLLFFKIEPKKKKAFHRVYYYKNMNWTPMLHLQQQNGMA